jgi:hypothetical protein
MTPAPATVSLPPRALRDRPKQAPRAAVEAPGHQVSIELLLARVTIRGVAGVSSAAVAEYVAILQRDLAAAARMVRLQAVTLVPPASIDDAVLDIVNAHDPEVCTDPCCVSDDELDDDLFVADEGHQVLVDSRGYLGVGSGGAW